ncbi:hypothetical protein ACWEO1_20825 [Kitasatospora cineracea]
MTKTVNVRGHVRKDGTRVRPHSRTIKGASSPSYSTSYSSSYNSSSGFGGGKAVAAGGSGLLLFVLFLVGISGGGGNAGTTGPSPTSSIVQQVGLHP